MLHAQLTLADDDVRGQFHAAWGQMSGCPCGRQNPAVDALRLAWGPYGDGGSCQDQDVMSDDEDAEDGDGNSTCQDQSLVSPRPDHWVVLCQLHWSAN